MATAAKLRTLGFGIEARRSKSHKYPQNRNDCRRNQNIDQGFSLGKAHTHLRLEGGRQDQALQGVSLTTVPEGRHGNQNGRGASAPDAPEAEGGRRTLSCGADRPNSHLCSKINIISKLSSQSSSRSWNLWAGLVERASVPASESGQGRPPHQYGQVKKANSANMNGILAFRGSVGAGAASTPLPVASYQIAIERIIICHSECNEESLFLSHRDS